MLVTTAFSASEYADIQVSGGRRPIVADVIVREHNVFVAAGAQVYKVPMNQCQRHNTCATCVQSGDPYCGWCTLQNE